MDDVRSPHPPPRASTAWTSRSTSRSTPRPTTRGSSEHPEWFQQRPDGTLKYAENPPKRYQDIYNFNWDTPAWRELWQAWRDVVIHWVDAGVKFFRVDNPHTKPFPFWEWLIERGPRARPRRGLPRRGVHPPRRHAPAGEDRLHPVLHVLHLEELPLGAERVRQRARPRAGARVLPPQLLHQHAGHPPRLPPARRAAGVRPRGSCWPARSSPTYGIYSGYEWFENEPVREGSEEYLELREVRDPSSARSTARCCRWSAASTRSGARTPRCSGSRTSPSSTPTTRP